MAVVLRAAAGALLALLLAGCATTGPATPGDPLERMNRGVYKFNDAIDRAVLKPVATGYRKGVPRVVRTGISNFLSNLAYPTVMVNNLLQGKFKDAATDLGRFALNCTLGLGGLLDPATHVGIPRNDEDFGQTLGRWGVPSGPYLVLPLIGPSTLRDGPSLLVDKETDLRTRLDIKQEERYALIALSVIDARVGLLSLDASLAETYDPYAFVRDAWLQRREYKVRDGDVPEEAPLEDFEDPGEIEDPAPPEESPGQTPAGSSSPETSLMPASDASASGMLR
jgi:phospholipid-binding lipoprotein MlaA